MHSYLKLKSWFAEENVCRKDTEIGLSVVDWIGLVQDRHRWRAIVNAVP
jgi:hypothetical protein